MKKVLLFTFSLLICGIVSSQVKREIFESRKLKSNRELKIKLPDNYNPDSELKHPVIIVFDGEYLFEPVAGQTDFQTHFDEMPKSIVVGIVQGKARFYDSYYDEVTGLPFESGKRFYDFVAEELIPYIDSSYNTSKFRVAVGHNLMGNFINAFLMAEAPLFQAYINLSPDFQGTMGQNVAKRLGFLENDIFYYLATSDGDIKRINKSIHETNNAIQSLEQLQLTYYFDELKGDTHYGLVTGALSKAMDKIFELYKPLDEKEIEEKIMPYEGTLDDYITDRYERIDELFGITKPISEIEFDQLVEVAERREDLESIYKIGKLANKQNPESLIGNYYMAQHAEKVGKTKRARKYYESALSLKESDKIDKDFIKSRLDELMKDKNDDSEVAVEELEKDYEEEQ
ncbi:MAG: alpha/beta hydrolase-fold protein [Bacteroidota bacterium]